MRLGFLPTLDKGIGWFIALATCLAARVDLS